jgi:hypothetical protein
LLKRRSFDLHGRAFIQRPLWKKKSRRSRGGPPSLRTSLEALGRGRSEEGYMTRYLAGAMAITIGSNIYTGLK